MHPFLSVYITLFLSLFLPLSLSLSSSLPPSLTLFCSSSLTLITYPPPPLPPPLRSSMQSLTAKAVLLSTWCALFLAKKSSERDCSCTCRVTRTGTLRPLTSGMLGVRYDLCGVVWCVWCSCVVSVCVVWCLCLCVWFNVVWCDVCVCGVVWCLFIVSVCVVCYFLGVI